MEMARLYGTQEALEMMSYSEYEDGTFMPTTLHCCPWMKTYSNCGHNKLVWGTLSGLFGTAALCSNAHFG